MTRKSLQPMQINEKALIAKYDLPVPRYTSFPTVPDWDNESFTREKYLEDLKLAYTQFGHEGISLYIHLPYCESLCTYCGCNTRISINHAVETPYISALLKEWHMYKEVIGERPKLKEIHLGGGTPTFFSPDNLKELITEIVASSDLVGDFDFSFEGHPNNTTKEHLKTLFDCGFSRVSFGIQDLDEKVQKAINRVQPVENVRQVTEWAREIGYTSVNYDLIYGLPFQNLKGIERTMDLVEELRPDRIAYYSYAHVPWKRPGQRAYSEQDLPAAEEKRALNKYGTERLQEAGYQSIGMDHFALPDDELSLAVNKGSLHRNFMGYTTNPGKILIGLGVSSISDVHYGYAQNLKTVEAYMDSLKEYTIPVFKGHRLTQEEIETRERILIVACHKAIPKELFITSEESVKNEIFEMVTEGLLIAQEGDYLITNLGAQFLRNICSLFDPYQKLQREQKAFSQGV